MKIRTFCFCKIENTRIFKNASAKFNFFLIRPEEEVLMRALRDFNIPKIVTDDMPVFIGLISDLFPALDVPRKYQKYRDIVLEIYPQV